jgi:hypothetical protein
MAPDSSAHVRMALVPKPLCVWSPVSCAPLFSNGAIAGPSTFDARLCLSARIGRSAIRRQQRPEWSKRRSDHKCREMTAKCREAPLIVTAEFWRCVENDPEARRCSAGDRASHGSRALQSGAINLDLLNSEDRHATVQALDLHEQAIRYAPLEEAIQPSPLICYAILGLLSPHQSILVSPSPLLEAAHNTYCPC